MTTHCMACGTLNLPDQAKFCPSCGASATTSPTSELTKDDSGSVADRLVHTAAMAVSLSSKQIPIFGDDISPVVAELVETSALKALHSDTTQRVMESIKEHAKDAHDRRKNRNSTEQKLSRVGWSTGAGVKQALNWHRSSNRSPRDKVAISYAIQQLRDEARERLPDGREVELTGIREPAPRVFAYIDGSKVLEIGPGWLHWKNADWSSSLVRLYFPNGITTKDGGKTFHYRLDCFDKHSDGVRGTSEPDPALCENGHQLSASSDCFDDCAENSS